jgi:hypothetical protein
MLKTLSTSLALCAALFLAAPVHAASHAGAPMAKEGSACEKSAIDKNGKPLAGAAKASYVKKCEAGGDGDKTCEAKAVDKNGKALAGAAKTSFLKKCSADAKK